MQFNSSEVQLVYMYYFFFVTGWITLIVFGVLAGLAIVACICVAVYIFCIKNRSVQLKTPIDDQEMGTPTEEKQPL